MCVCIYAVLQNFIQLSLTLTNLGHRFSIYQSQVHYDIRKFNFTNRIISVWNSLPDAVVSANTVNTFKNKLDRLWQDQEVRYNWKADICSGNRSQVNVILD